MTYATDELLIAVENALYDRPDLDQRILTIDTIYPIILEQVAKEIKALTIDTPIETLEDGYKPKEIFQMGYEDGKQQTIKIVRAMIKK